MNNAILIVLMFITNGVLTYLTQRMILKVSAEPQYHPVAFMIVLWFIPILGLLVSLIILISEFFSNNKNEKNEKKLNYKTIFRIK